VTVKFHFQARNKKKEIKRTHMESCVANQSHTGYDVKSIKTEVKKRKEKVAHRHTHCDQRKSLTFSCSRGKKSQWNWSNGTYLLNSSSGTVIGYIARSVFPAKKHQGFSSMSYLQCVSGSQAAERKRHRPWGKEATTESRLPRYGREDKERKQLRKRCVFHCYQFNVSLTHFTKIHFWVNLILVEIWGTLTFLLSKPNLNYW
jgi:hypothetical protein